jgi:hypothetical protein
MKCHYPYTGGGCDQPASTIIIYGCLNQHTEDTALCENHHQQWLSIQAAHHWRCTHCDHPIADYDTTPITLRITATHKPSHHLTSPIK